MSLVTGPLLGVFDTEQKRLIGITQNGGTPDITYFAGQDTPTPAGAVPVVAETNLVTGGVELSAGDVKKNIVTSQINDFLTAEEIADARSRNPVVDVGEKINEAIQKSSVLFFEAGSVYLTSVPIVIDAPITVSGGGTWATLYNGSTGIDPVSDGVAVIRAAGGFSGDVLTVRPEAVGAQVSGLYIDCTRQESGNGLVCAGSSLYRSNRQFSDICVQGAHGSGVVLSSVKEDFFCRVYARDNGAYGWDINGSDIFFERCFSSKNTLSGFRWQEGSGAGRFTRCDSWDNDEYGVLLEGQNCSFLSLQCDLNTLGAVRIRKASAGSVAPKRFSFVGGNSLGQGASAADFHISDNASNVVITGWNFGYGHSADPALYAVLDDSSGGVGNSIIGCSFEKGAYSSLISPNVYKYWATQGHSADFGMLSQAATDAQNLLINGDFEVWVSGAGGVPAGWSAVSGNGSSALDSTFGFSNYACKLTASSVDNTQGIQQVLDVPPGYLKNKRVTLTAVVSASGTEAKFIEIREGGSVTQYPVTPDGITRTISVFRDFTSSSDCTIRITNKTAGNGATTGTLIVDRMVVAVGSAVDSYSANPKGNAVGFGTLDATATPSVRGFENWVVQGATAITSFTNSYEGKTIVIVGNGSVQITHGTIVLKSGASVTLASGAAMTLRHINNAWREI